MTSKSTPYRILIVDDAPSVREGLRWLLENEPNLQVVGEAANGLEALRSAAALMPDLLIRESEMPYLDGLEVAQAIKAALEPPKILFVSINGDVLMREQARIAGGDGFVEKGEGWPALIAQLRAILELP
jgi:DNA-binding NarL/FixJ family response regulator